MAVLDLYPGLEVEILVDDIPTREYIYISDTIPPPCHVTKYIVARTDARFAIRYTISRDFSLLAGELLASVYCDGNYVESYIARPEDIYCKTGHIITPPDTTVDGVLRKQVFKFGASQNGMCGAFKIFARLNR
ncbi:hypothetical protein GMOD_00006017 [Pyrenophora seminiperda CCB06]|uniref:DUF7918 domain-containing protein n=1 Tax=Pyrenophora seminiperda CCB06 TaxID=1302712 RepID=A0A3M7M488_9PLEO|nr:hypothetical protein GMOD_00006017 [Pyrenophora seminiperda CCB06]